MSNEELVKEIQAGQSELMGDLYQQNMGLLKKLCRKYAGYADIEDLLQECYLGLVAAVDHYEPEQCSKFMTYAYYWIIAQLQEYLGKNTGISCRDNDDITRLRQFTARIMSRYGRQPSDYEICACLDISDKRLDHLRTLGQFLAAKRFNEPFDEDGNTLEDLIPDDYQTEQAYCDQEGCKYLYAALHEALDRLDTLDFECLTMVYRDKALKRDIAAKLGVTYESVRKHTDKAMRKLRCDRALRAAAIDVDYIQANAYRGGSVASFHRTRTSVTERLALDLLDPTTVACRMDRM